VVRSEKVALYEQVDDEGSIVGHELFLVKILQEGEVFGIMMPERESYPSTENFGITAWSVGRDRDRAILKYAELVTSL